MDCLQPDGAAMQTPFWEPDSGNHTLIAFGREGEEAEVRVGAALQNFLRKKKEEFWFHVRKKRGTKEGKPAKPAKPQAKPQAKPHPISTPA